MSATLFGVRGRGGASPASLPSWVPAPGQVVAYTAGGGVLTNNFRSVIAPYFDAFYSIKIVNDYSSAIANPHLGPRGGLVFVGAGHSASNDGSVIGLIFGESTISFARLTNPSPYFGSGTDSGTKSSNSISSISSLLDANWGDTIAAVETPPQPTGFHSYGVGDIIPPPFGGTFGTYFTPFRQAAGHFNSGNFGGAHYLPIQSLSDPAANVYARAANSRVNTGIGAPGFTAYDDTARRSYFMTRDNGTPTRWFDHVTETYGQGTGEGLNNGAADDPDSGCLLYIPSRRMLVSLTRESTLLVVRYADVSGSVPGPRSTATLSASITPRLRGGSVPFKAWHTAFWCPESNRIVVGNVMNGGSPDNDAVIEIEIPANPANTWPVTRQIFALGSSMPWPVGSWQNLCYVPQVRCAAVLFNALNSGNDTLYVFRPHGT